MKLLVGMLLFVSAWGCLAAEAYKWVDEKGVTNYGEKPPASSQAKPVNTQPGAVLETGGRFAQKKEAELRPSTEEARLPQAVAPAPGPSVPVRGMDFETYIRLQRGMTEGELLLRAGKPDHESLDNIRHDIVKTYYYFPTTADPYVTVVKMRGGRIHSLDRIKKF